MPVSQKELNAERLELLNKFKESAPEILEAEGKVIEIAYKDGALPTKIKRMMAMAIALGAGCRNCILAQTQLALDAGATKDEILESLQVVVAIRGTTGIAESLRVIKFLEELGEL